MLGAAGRRYLDDQIRVGVRNVPVKKYDRTVKRMSAEELGGKLQSIRFAKGTLASDGEKSILYFDGSGCMWNVRKGSWEREVLTAKHLRESLKYMVKKGVFAGCFEQYSPCER